MSFFVEATHSICVGGYWKQQTDTHRDLCFSFHDFLLLFGEQFIEFTMVGRHSVKQKLNLICLLALEQINGTTCDKLICNLLLELILIPPTSGCCRLWFRMNAWQEFLQSVSECQLLGFLRCFWLTAHSFYKIPQLPRLLHILSMELE